MVFTGRRLVVKLADGLPEARYEAVLALLRACLCGVGFVTLLLISESLLAPALVNAAIAVASLLLAVRLATVTSIESARRYGRWSTGVDVALFAAYSVAFASRPGAGALYGAFVLVIGPVRYGLRGIPATAVPVALVAALWPQLDASGTTAPVGEILFLCAVFALAPVAVRAVLMRGSARLRLAEQQFSTAFEHASIGMALTDRELRVLQANRSLGVLLGETPADLLHARLDAAVDRLDRPRLEAALRGLTPEAPSTRLEVRLRRPDGGLRWGHVSASLLAGACGVAAKIVVQVENITERKRSEAMLSHAAAHDALTDLPNRTLLLARLEAALNHGDQIGVLFIDLDRFKVVNDGLGHAVGDLLLVQLANRLREAMRPDDLVARLGGDEFVVLCRNADLDIVMSVADRVLEALNHPVTTTGGSEVVIGASIGISLAGPGDVAELVLREADTAMYAAKGAGGGRVHVFSPDLLDAVVRTHELEVDLRLAVRAGEVRVVYQPVYDLLLGRITGCEALARWTHPTRGPVPPQDFCAVAEQSDLILELGDWVLRQALNDARDWPAQPDGPVPSVAVNVSLRQLVSGGFAERVSQFVEEAGIDASRLCLEVTETVLAGDVQPVVEVLEALRDLGVRLAIDDFGTGHASLTYLARFPVDQVKIDQSFVAGLGIDAGSAAIVGGVVAMAHTFDMRVVAEGVETEGQLEALRALGCDAVQGYLLSVPRAPEEIEFLLRRGVTHQIPRPREDWAPDPRVHEASSDEPRRYRLLVEGAKQVTGLRELDAVFEQTFKALRSAVSFTGGAIMLVEDDQVRIAAALPAPTVEAMAARIPLGHGVSGTIALTGEPRYLPDITIASTVTSNRRTTNTSTGVRSWFGVPLIAEGRPIGVLQVDSTEVDAFGEADRLAVLSFAPVVALAVVSARQTEARLRGLPQGS